MAAQRKATEEQDVVVIDPICGAPVLAGDLETVSLRHAGRTWRFCSQDCCGRFARQAEQAILEESLRAGRLLTPRGRARWGVG
jgi:YHS domain-containing protein